MLGDGLVPSNAKAGYLARMLSRRTLRLRDDLGLEISLSQLAKHHLEVNLAGQTMKQSQDGILGILQLEEERYGEMIRKGGNVIVTQLQNLPKDTESIPDDVLFQLNDSHGLAPEMVLALAKDAGWGRVKIRTGFAAEMAERHAKMAKIAAQHVEVKHFVQVMPNIPPSIALYYEDVQQKEFDASVLSCQPLTGLTSTHITL